MSKNISAPQVSSPLLQRQASTWFVAFRSALYIYACIFIVFIAITFLVPVLLVGGDRPEPLVDGSHPLFAFWRAWYRFDTEHYLTIVRQGYEQALGRAAFFPLYPLLVRLFTFVVRDPLVAGLLISHLAGILLLTVSYRFLQEEWGEKAGKRAFWYFVCFPTACFLWVAYTEALFLLLFVCSLYAMRRKRWWIVGLCGLLITMTRPNGLLVLPLYAFEYVRQIHFDWRAIRWNVLALGLVPLGMLSYAVYCAFQYGDLLAFSHAQSAWQRYYHVPGQDIIAMFIRIVQHDWLFTLQSNLLDLLPDLLCLFVLVLGLLRKLDLGERHWSYLLYATLLWLFLHTTSPGGNNPPLMSMGRYLLSLFPMFPLLAGLGERSRWFHWLYMGGGIVLQLLWLVLFAAGRGVV